MLDIDKPRKWSPRKDRIHKLLEISWEKSMITDKAKKLKKDGSLRICIDYRESNKITRRDSYPLPKIDTVLQCLNGKKVFSTMDLTSGYWQIRLSEEARRKSAFTTSEGLYQFTALPFGLSTSPADFQSMMDMVLEGLDAVLGALRKANLRLKPQKCEFFKESGHLIDKNGVRTDCEKRKVANGSKLREDDDYREILNSINVGNGYKDVKVPRCSRRFRVADFFVDDGELELVLENSMVKVVPKSKRRKLFDEAHEGLLAGHLNARKLYRKLKKIVFGEGMEADISKWSEE
ncbi:hypothetical protein COOONC_00611 [Cooperia oncophora]